MNFAIALMLINGMCVVINFITMRRNQARAWALERNAMDLVIDRKEYDRRIDALRDLEARIGMTAVTVSNPQVRVHTDMIDLILSRHDKPETKH